MPQLDTSTWFIVMLSSTISLFTIFQLKFSSQIFHSPITTEPMKLMTKNPWEHKWTKTYLPLSLPPQ